MENTADNEPVTVVAEWITDGTPKYFEGIPAGDYILEESEAPDGYIRCSMELEVKETGQVQTIHVKDDHTKLEVYKYCRDEVGTMVPLPNDHAAGLALYEAYTDADGNIVTTDGLPEYDETKMVDEWTTDGLAEFTELPKHGGNFMDKLKRFLGITKSPGFLTAFEKGYKSQGNSFVYVTWETTDGRWSADRTQISQTAQGEGVVETWKTNTGKTIRITIYQDLQNGSLDETGNLPWKFEYQFNYKELPGAVKSYDTLEGMHRIDYLPFDARKDGNRVGNYVLVETNVPDGYEKADAKAIVLTEKGDVQRYSLENTQKYLDILKVIEDDATEYAARGVTLALYKADESGNFTDAQSNLVESWVSGEDGTYTEQDQLHGTIPDGFTVGDLKPHRITKVPYGIYYVAEWEAPPYMAKGDPVRVEAGAETAAVIRIRNKPTQGQLVITKTGTDTGETLENARFLVSNQDTKETWYVTTGNDGRAKLPGLPVGEVQTDGTVRPFTYAIEEISPPDHYQIFGGKKFFRFDGSDSSKVVTYTYEVGDQPTVIRFKKTDFHTGMAVEGARVAIYHAVAVDGEYRKDGEAIETVVTGPDGFTLTKELSAGQTYIMEELEAPAGMHVSAPVVFKINQAGTGIEHVDTDFSVLEITGADGTVESLTVNGRAANKVSVVLKDLDTGEELSAMTGSTDRMMTAEDGLKDGHVYEITEYTRYSDGNVEMSAKETKRIRLDADGTYTLHLRTYINTHMELADLDGNVLDAWETDGGQLIHTIENPVTEEKTIADVSGKAGTGYTAVKKGDVVNYSLRYENPYSVPVDVTVKAVLEEGLDFLRADGQPEVSNGTVNWEIKDAAPHTTGSLELAAVVTGRPGTQTKASFHTTAGKTRAQTVLENPIAPKGSLTLRNHISGLGKNPEDAFAYRIKFLDQEGNVLSGYQSYTGSMEGRIKGEGTILLKHEEYVTFHGLPYGVRYEISPKTPEGYEQTSAGETGTIVKEAISAVFENTKNDKAVREILTAGGNYQLTETTAYSDGANLQSGMYRFSLNASGSIDNVDMEDRPIQLYFSKRDITTDEEMTGGRYSLADAVTGEIIYEFHKTEDKEVQIPADILTPGKEYVFREELAPDGYAYEDTIHVTVNEAGIPEVVIMQDKKTDVALLKIDADTKEPLRGGRYQVKDSKGVVVYQFTALGTPERLYGILTAGESYMFAEVEPPPGYAYSGEIRFKVPENPEPIEIVMEDKPTNVIVEKLTETMAASPSEAESQLAGFRLQILHADRSPAVAVKNTSDFRAGDELIFTTSEQFERLVGQLIAGQSYWLHEISPREGYAFADDVKFEVSLDGGGDTVVMIDKPTRIVVSKKAITGDRELPGNHMSIRDKEGSVIEEWVSGEEPHEIIAKLTAGETYLLCEDQPLKGYAYADAVEFKVSLDGSIDRVEMKNEVTNVHILKVNRAGLPLKGAILQVLDAQKHVVIDKFESTGEVVELQGQLRAGKNYYLHEVQAPAGYLLSSDVPFTVPKDANVIEVKMTDPKKPAPNPDVNQMYLQKVDASTGKGIEGVEFSVYEPDGGLYCVYITGYGGYARFDMPRDGTYTYRETKAAPGYMTLDESYHFTIRNGRVDNQSTVSVVNVQTPDVKIETLIPRREQAPFAGYEQLLLDLIHVDSDYYRIDRVEWENGPWTEHGIVYRKAAAKGSKLVADVKAYYEGSALFESKKGYAVRSVYQLHEAKPETVESAGDSGRETHPGLWDYLKKLWEIMNHLMNTHPVISISIGLVILVAAFVLILHRLSKKKEERTNNDGRNRGKPGTDRNDDTSPTDAP